MPKGVYPMKKIIISLLTLTMLTVGGIVVVKYVIKDVQTVSRVSEHQQASERQHFIHEAREWAVVEPPLFTEDELMYLTTTYLALIKQPVDEGNHLTEVASMEGLYDLFAEVATPNVSKDHLAYYFSETDRGIYLRPTELPPWFDENQQYDMQRVADLKVIVRQRITDIELYGPYMIELHFGYDEKKWKITNVKIEYNNV